MTEQEKLVLRAIKDRMLDVRGRSHARSVTMRLEEADVLVGLVERLTDVPEPVILEHDPKRA